MEQVESFIYLGATFTSDGRCEKEIRIRIDMDIDIAKSNFNSNLSKVHNHVRM